MAVLRIAFSVVKTGFHNSQSASKLSKFRVMACAVCVRSISSFEVTKNITLLTDEKKNWKIKDLRLEMSEEKPLVVLLSWLMAKKKHIHKYADIYLQHGIDVLNIHVTPWQLLWPTKGTHMLADDILKFLDVNKSYSPLVVHGFSVGGYVWGEVLVKIAAEQERYQHIIDRIVGQVWDSVADLTEIPVGLPIAVFPRNAVMQSALRKYVLYHMKAFDKVATRHYVRSSQMFHTTVVRAPAQFFLSKTDPVGTEASNLRCTECWRNMGIQVFWKCWDKSPHVGHFRKYPKEYRDELCKFLDHIQLPHTAQQKVRVKI